MRQSRKSQHIFGVIHSDIPTCHDIFFAGKTKAKKEPVPLQSPVPALQYNLWADSPLSSTPYSPLLAPPGTCEPDWKVAAEPEPEEGRRGTPGGCEA